MHLIPALRRRRQASLCEFETSLVYRTSSKIAGATRRNPVFWFYLLFFYGGRTMMFFSTGVLAQRLQGPGPAFAPWR